MEPRPRSAKPWDNLQRLALANHGIFTADDARRDGVTPQTLNRAVAAGRAERVLPKTYRLVGTEQTWEQELLSFCRWSGGVASHRAAAALWRLSGIPAGTIELVVSHPRKKVRADLVLHVSGELPNGDRSSVAGIPVTSPTRTLLDLGAVVEETVLETALEDALRRGLTSPARIRWQLQTQGQRGRAGTAALRRLIAIRSEQPAAESALETRLARWFRSTKLPPPVRQHRLVVDDRVIARFDFAYPDKKLAIEAHSFMWHSGRDRWVKDVQRERLVRMAGWDVMYVVDEDLRRGALEEQIAERLGLRLF